MLIKKKRNNKNGVTATKEKAITIRQQIKELIDIIGHRELQEYREGCLDDICKVLQQHIDIKTNNWIQSFEHHEQKEKEWLEKGEFVFYVLHHSMKIYSNGATHGLQFFKDELLLLKKIENGSKT
jgi:hypothetical protein